MMHWRAGTTLRAGAVVAAIAAPALVFTTQVGAAQPTKGATYKGHTSFDFPDQLDVSKNGKSLDFAIIWRGVCQRSDPANPNNRFIFQTETDASAVKIGGRGKFSLHGTYMQNADRHYAPNISNGYDASAYTATITAKGKGKFKNARHASGTFDATAVIKNKSGSRVDTCQSESVSWRAHRTS